MDYIARNKAFIGEMNRLDAENVQRAKQVPNATGGKRQPVSGSKARKVTVKSHVRKVKPKAPNPAPTHVPPIDPQTKALLEAAVRMKFGGVEQGLNQQLQSNARFSSGVPAWYSQAINEIKGIGAQGMAQGQQAIQQAQAVNSPAAATGTPDAAQAANARNSLNSQYATMLTRDQQANQDFLSRMQAGMQVQQGNTLNQANRDRQGILAQQGALAGQKGDFRVGLVADQQAASQKADLEGRKLQASLAIADGKLDLARDILNDVTKPKTRATIKQGATRVKTDRIRVRDQKQQQGIKNAQWANEQALKAYTLAHPELKAKGGRTAAGKSPFTPTQRRKAASTFRTLAGGMDDNAVRKDPNKAVEALVKGRKTDPVVANAVVESIMNHGSVSRETATAYFRATGHHLHVSRNAQHVGRNIGQIFQGLLQKYGG